MISPRLKMIASLVDKEAKVIDIGTDHAYVPIYLVQNNITKNILATDISPKVITFCQKNIIQNHCEDYIRLQVSDGFQNITENFDLAIIAGMGTKTIMHILDTENLPPKIIIQSNNDLPSLRKFMLTKGYKIAAEKVIFDKKYYSIIKYVKGKESLKEAEILFGKSNNITYWLYLKNKYLTLYAKSKKEEYQKYGLLLQNLIEKTLEEKAKKN